MDELTPVGQTYLDVERFIHMLVHEAVAKWRLDYQEVLSVAHLGFMEAYESYRPELGEFLDRVRAIVQYRIKDMLRDLVKRQGREVCVDDLEFVPDTEGTRFDLDSLLERMSDDAGKVIKRTLKPPPDVKLSMAQLGGEMPANYRQALREYFGYAGWSERRIRKTFVEIKEKL